MAISALAELATEYGDLAGYGFRIERYGSKGWALFVDYGDGSPEAQCMIGNYGGLAPRKSDAELEAYGRIHRDNRIAADAGMPLPWVASR